MRLKTTQGGVAGCKAARGNGVDIWYGEPPSSLAYRLRGAEVVRGVRTTHGRPCHVGAACVASDVWMAHAPVGAVDGAAFHRDAHVGKYPCRLVQKAVSHSEEV
jgi:hypothetical protein